MGRPLGNRPLIMVSLMGIGAALWPVMGRLYTPARRGKWKDLIGEVCN